jgi:GTP-binding protein HflX
MSTQSKQRQREYRIALVGYTNAGKSSLMNRIAKAHVYVKDELFATLDATTRRVESSGAPPFLLTDTVGFIRKLPHHLVESFRATLSEAQDADLLLHVVDVSGEDPVGMKLAVDAVLEEIGAGSQPVQVVLNKIDLVSTERLHDVQSEFPQSIAVSAQNGAGFEELLQAIAARQHGLERVVKLRIPAEETRSIALLHEYSHVERLEWRNGSAWIEARVDGPGFGRILKLSGVELLETARIRHGF